MLNVREVREGDVKLIVGANSRKVYCRYRKCYGHTGCLGEECENWRRWLGTDRGYCERTRRERGICGIEQGPQQDIAA